MTPQRIITALIAFGAFLGILSVDWFFETHLASLILLTGISAMALAELYAMLHRIGLPSRPTYGVVSLCLLFAARGLLGYLGLTDPQVWAVTGFLFAGIVALPFTTCMFGESARLAGGREEITGTAVTLLGLLVVWFLLSFLLELRLLDDGSGTTRFGLELVIILILSVKIGDSAAYLVGRSIGTHPLCWVSPRKTWEGAAGCVVGTVITATVLGLVFGIIWWQAALYGLLISIAGQFGDLMESLLKRRSGVKDSGSFFREAGGFLDLLDSLLLASPVAYLFVRLVVL